MIHWYPGHMAKAKREIQENLRQVDIVYLLLDARIPKASFNQDLYEIIKHKPILYLYNKSTLADLNKLNKNLLDNSLVIDALKRTNVSKIEPLTRKILSDYINRQKEKGYKTVSIKAMIIGIPNVGKSTLINALSKSRRVSTNKIPGHTRALKWTLIGNEVYLLDTPGILYPKIENEKDGYHLALTGAIKEELLPKEKLALYAFNFLFKKYFNYISSFYKIDEADPFLFFKKLAEHRGYYSGKELDLNKSYNAFLTDLKEGKLGPVYYE